MYLHQCFQNHQLLSSQLVASSDLPAIEKTHIYDPINIGITHHFMFDHEAARPSAQTSSQVPPKC